MMSIVRGVVKVCPTIFDFRIRSIDPILVMILHFQMDYLLIDVYWNCKFFGTAPFCKGKCKDGYEEIFESSGWTLGNEMELSEERFRGHV